MRLSKKQLETLQKQVEEFVAPFREWALNAHNDTNHYYDDYLPYEFHLRMVVHNVWRYIHNIYDPNNHDETIKNVVVVVNGGWGHDTIEDARQNYNAVKKMAGILVAEIVRACTNYGRGRDRDERMPDYIYKEIFDTLFATFVKLCDRMANVQYSKMTGSSMFDKYKKEHKHFKHMLYVEGQYEDMWEDLEIMFGIKQETFA